MSAKIAKKNRDKKPLKWPKIKREPWADNRDYLGCDSPFALFVPFAAVPSLRSFLTDIALAKSVAAIPICILSKRLSVNPCAILFSRLVGQAEGTGESVLLFNNYRPSVR